MTGCTNAVAAAERYRAAEPDPLPGAAPVSVEEALAAVAGWQKSSRLFGLHQISIALAAEVERLRALAQALVRDHASETENVQ